MRVSCGFLRGCIHPANHTQALGEVLCLRQPTSRATTAPTFGNTQYNDHHFHYGYHILAAAAIAHLDPSWLSANKDYVNALVRDVANPSTQDTYFPTWRAFDWYHGHSWAHGLYASYDGKVS